MKRILLITVTFPPRIGGMEKVLYNIVENSQFSFEVFTPRSSEGDIFDKNQNSEIIRYSPALKSIFLFLFALYFLVRNNHRYKVIYLGQINPWLGLAVLFNKWLFGKQYLIHTHGKDIAAWSKKENRGMKLFIVKKIIKNAQAIFAISDWGKNQLLNLGVSSEKVKVVHNGVNFSKFQREFSPYAFKNKYEIKQDKYLILTVSRLEKRKGHDMVIEALPKIVEVKPQVKYLIVGEGSQRRVLEEEITKRNLEEKVVFTGKVDHKELINFYQICDLFVMPNRIEGQKNVEGFGLVFLEANACGKPVIGGDSGGVPSAVKNGKTGFLVDPRNASEIAEKVILLLKDKSLRVKMGKNGEQWACQHDWRRQVTTIDKIISSSLS